MENRAIPKALRHVHRMIATLQLIDYMRENGWPRAGSDVADWAVDQPATFPSADALLVAIASDLRPDAAWATPGERYQAALLRGVVRGLDVLTED